MERGQALSMLRTALARDDADLHPGQWEAIDALVNRSSRVLVVQRTGWGKSVVYFIATRELRNQGRGTTLLISPLLALMRNQVLAAERLGLKAERIASDNREDWEQTAERVRAGDIDLLIVSPERLANEEFREDVLLPLAEVMGMFVVDEAHCISDWGHDFRPDYRRIARVLKTLPPNIPVLATTATANDRVVEHIEVQMGNEMELVRGPLTRPSLRFQNIELPHRAARLAWLAEQVPNLPGGGIIYVLTKRDAHVVAEWLQSRGIETEAYHGGDESSGMPAERREALE